MNTYSGLSSDKREKKYHAFTSIRDFPQVEMFEPSDRASDEQDEDKRRVDHPKKELDCSADLRGSYSTRSISSDQLVDVVLCVYVCIYVLRQQVVFPLTVRMYVL